MASMAQQDYSRPVVLIVDNYEDTRVAYALALSTMGFDVIAAKDGQEGRDHARNVRPDVIVTDLEESEEPGVATLDPLGPLGLDAQLQDIPVVIVTDRLKSPDYEPVAGSRYAGFITKPCAPEQLAVALWQVVDRERAVKIARKILHHQ